MAYSLASSRSQLWLSRTGGAFPLLSVGAFLLRLTLFGVLLFAVDRVTPLDVVVVATAFVATFTVVSGYALVRFARKRPSAAASSHVAP